MNFFRPRTLVPFLFLLGLATGALAADKLKPFVLASTGSGDVAAMAAQVKGKLQQAGFEIAGEYAPYPDATILAVTSDALKQAAAQSDYGAFGAVQRVTVTQGKNGQVQVAFTNPTYMAAAYRMKSDLAPVTDKLKQALGDKQSYGPDEGLTADDLHDYHYKWLMPYFTDRLQLASYSSHDKAVQAIEKALSEKQGGVSKVYRVDIPGGKETVFGVHMTEDCSGDKYIMDRIDFKDLRSTGHLPYEMVVHGGKVYALPAEFRIAINFPDLSMMGSNSFASIMCAPNAIETALTKAAGGSVSTSNW